MDGTYNKKNYLIFSAPYNANIMAYIVVQIIIFLKVISLRNKSQKGLPLGLWGFVFVALPGLFSYVLFFYFLFYFIFFIFFFFLELETKIHKVTLLCVLYYRSAVLRQF